MRAKLKNLTANPCKMCMPMGAVHVFYGIARCMTLLHGSQGCSTYIRRHMATHYNEPVDIASSALTEEGTVYGGEKNLIKGIHNLCKMYDPDVIGIATTCLSETIGEDIDRIIKNYHAQYPESRVTLIPVTTGGYMGTQFEGYFRTLHSIVRHVEMKPEKHNGINIITGMLSPSDVRALRDMLSLFHLEYILLPDASENLDGGHEAEYRRLHENGTTLDRIARMGGARLTIELNLFNPPEYSPGEYLKEKYGVPLVRINPPVGLRDTDAFINLLSEISGLPVPDRLKNERSRYLDAMIDSHKYNAEGRAVIFGDPDFVYSMGRLCCENGLLPVVCATGTSNPRLKELLSDEVGKTASTLFAEDFELLDETDFEQIEILALKHKANLLIGSSDGRRIEEKHGIPLVRCAFPIHDRVGGQRINTLGYAGSLNVLDSFTNTLLHIKEGSYRKNLYQTYHKPDKEKKTQATEKHPCFSCSGAHKYARIHLPVAPDCNIQCKYCVRKFDCPNESRPGVTTQVLTPQQALQRFLEVREKLGNLTVAGIAGPGDALADFEKTRETLRLIREKDPDITFCLSTNGLALPQYVDDLVALGVTHVTITINAVDATIASEIYAHVNIMGMRYSGMAAAAMLISNQLTGLKLLVSRGIVCKVNCVVLQGINDHHIDKVVEAVKSLGASVTNIMQLIPVKGSAFEHMEMLSAKAINAIRKKCEQILPQMYHCKQCRADAVGLLEEDRSLEFQEVKETVKAPKEKQGLRFAIATKSGLLVDQHFGQVDEFLVYEYSEGRVSFIERRNIVQYCKGAGACDDQEDKMTRIFNVLKDCEGVIALRIGAAPQKRLEEKGIQAYTTYDRIEEAIKKIAREMMGEEAV